MGLLETLMSSGLRKEYEDFARRFEVGAPWEGYSDKEVMDRYGEVAHKLASSDYGAAAREALSRLTPEQQAELGRYLQRARAQGVQLPEQGSAPQAGGLDALVRSVQGLHEQPGRLRELLGGLSPSESAGLPDRGRARGGGQDFPEPVGQGSHRRHHCAARAAHTGREVKCPCWTSSGSLSSVWSSARSPNS